MLLKRPLWLIRDGEGQRRRVLQRWTQTQRQGPARVNLPCTDTTHSRQRLHRLRQPERPFAHDGSSACPMSPQTKLHYHGTRWVTTSLGRTTHVQLLHDKMKVSTKAAAKLRGSQDCT